LEQILVSPYLHGFLASSRSGADACQNSVHMLVLVVFKERML